MSRGLKITFLAHAIVGLVFGLVLCLIPATRANLSTRHRLMRPLRGSMGQSCWDCLSVPGRGIAPRVGMRCASSFRWRSSSLCWVGSPVCTQPCFQARRSSSGCRLSSTGVSRRRGFTFVGRRSPDREARQNARRIRCKVCASPEFALRQAHRFSA